MLRNGDWRFIPKRGICIKAPITKAQRKLQEKRQEEYKNQRMKRNAGKGSIVNEAWPLHSGTHSSCISYTGANYPTDIGHMVSRSHPLLRSYWKWLIFGRKYIIFWRYSHCYVSHVKMAEPHPRACTEHLLYLVKSKVMALGWLHWEDLVELMWVDGEE